MKNESTSLLYSIDEKEEIILINTFLIDNRNRKLNLENMSSINHEELSYDKLLTLIDEMRENLPSYKDCVNDIVKHIADARDKFNEALLPLHINSNYSDSILERYYSKNLYEIAKEEERNLYWNSFNILLFGYYHRKSKKKIIDKFNSIEKTISDEPAINTNNKNDICSTPHKRTAIINYSGQKNQFVYADSNLQNLFYDFYKTLSKNKKHICECSKCHKRFIDDKRSKTCNSCAIETKNDNKCEISSSPSYEADKNENILFSTSELKEIIINNLRQRKNDNMNKFKDDKVAVEAIKKKHAELKDRVDKKFDIYIKENRTTVDANMLAFQKEIYNDMKAFLKNIKSSYKGVNKKQ